MDDLAAVPEFLPQALDMHVDGPAFTFIGKAPNGFHDLFSFQNDIRIDQKVPEKFKLLDGQMTGLPVDGTVCFS